MRRANGRMEGELARCASVGQRLPGAADVSGADNRAPGWRRLHSMQLR